MGLLDIFKRKTRIVELRSFDIQEPDEITRKLEQLCEQRHNCDILIGEEIFSSIFLSKREDRFLIDLMIPLSGNIMLRDGMGVRIGFLERRIPYTMNCIYLGREVEDRFESLAFSLPTLIRYSNRRSYYRINPGKSTQLRVLFDLGLSNVIDVGVENISGGGLAVRTKLAQYLQPGARVDRVDIILPDSSWISCVGTVVRLQGQIAGIKLEELSFNDRRHIIRFVAERQQEEIQRQQEAP
jgi:c-di-GMP-binding flagellar brake protein YcgR